MLHHAATLGGAIVRRAAYVGDGQGTIHQLPGWAWLVFGADFLVFFPVFLFIGYALAHVYPTLAIIEDPEPPAYDHVDLNADDEDAESTADLSHHDLKVELGEPALVSSSLRQINRLLLSTAGWTANFRGIACALVLSVATGACGLIFDQVLFIPRAVGVLLAALVTVQLSTAWTHIVISAPSELRFYQRLPPFRKTFEATCVPIAAYWAATQLVGFLPFALASAMGLSQFDVRNPTQVPEYHFDAVWKVLAIFAVVVASTLFLVIPAQAVLVRVQASLLPPDENTIIAFDKSFGGKVEPAIVGGKGYVNFVDAWKSFSRESWVRLYRLMGKILLVTLAVYLAVAAIVVPEFMLMVSASEPAGPGSE